MGRLSAAMTRMWPALLEDHQKMVQTYMDNPLQVIAAMLLSTARVLGLNLSYEKGLRGTRGTRGTWIGVTIEVDQETREIVLDTPRKLVDDLLEKLRGKGMIPLRELRSTTGKLRWAAKIYLMGGGNLLWCVVADAERELKEGIE